MDDGGGLKILQRFANHSVHTFTLAEAIAVVKLLSQTNAATAHETILFRRTLPLCVEATAVPGY